MTDQATAARENAISLEAKKDGLQQKQSGDWMLRFTVSAADMAQKEAQRFISAAMGARYVLVLVEVGDNEEAIDHLGIERGKWRDLGATRQAGMRCKEPLFWAFLRETRGYSATYDEPAAAEAVRAICDLESRADLDKPGNSEARIKWHKLDDAFQAWKYNENAG